MTTPLRRRRIASTAATLLVVAATTVPVAVPAGAEAVGRTALGGGVEVTHVELGDPPAPGLSVASVVSAPVPDAATVAVVTWTGDPDAELVARFVAGSGEVVGTVDGLAAGHDAPDGNEGSPTGRLASFPVLVPDDASAMQIVIRRGMPEDLRVDFLHVPDRPAAVSSASPPPVIGAAQPPIRPNEDWGNPGWVHGNEDCEDGPREPGYLDRAAIHHTVNSNSYPASAVDDLLMAIYHSHTGVNGWCDIGYNFVIDRFGTTWEGRAQSIEKPIQGGHTSGINPGSVGIALLGNHQATPGGVPAPAGSAERIAAIVSWRFSVAGADPAATVQVGVKNDEYELDGQRLTVPAIYGHREVEATTCPGDLAFGVVAQVRAMVQVTPPADPTVAINNRHGDGPPAVHGTVDLGDHELLVGDWNGDGTDTFGYYEAPYFHLWNSMHSTEPDVVVKYGIPGDTALVGDWDGDDTDTIGVRRGNILHLRNTNTVGPAHHTYSFGRAGDEVLVGDWDGDDTDTVGTRRGNVIYLNNGFRQGPADIAYGFAKAADTIVVGDWDGDRRDTLGTRRGARLYLGNRTVSGPADLVYDFATPDAHVEFGDWNGDWITTPSLILPR